MATTPGRGVAFRGGSRAVDAAGMRRWLRNGLAALAAAREEVDALNVYPVPDGDTGTNLYLTWESAVRAVDELPATATLAEVSRAMSRGALVGAHGNSGAILAQMVQAGSGVLRDWDMQAGALLRSGARLAAAAAPGQPRARLSALAVAGEVLCQAFEAAAAQAHHAVARPVEGTVLTVARAAADAARAGLAQAEDLYGLMAVTAEGARLALTRTTLQLPVLERAGVVDAGGRGLVVILDALVQTVAGASPHRHAGRLARAPLPVRLPGMASVLETAAESYSGGPEFEVMFLLDADAQAVDELRPSLDALGDSLVVVGGDGLWQVHVHVDDAGAAVELAMTAGRPHRLRITYLPEQAERRRASRAPRAGRAVVIAVGGRGLARLAEDAGGVPVLAVGNLPSSDDLLEGIIGSGCLEVVVLTSDGDVIASAEAAAEQARDQGVQVSVVPTRAVVQSLAALSVHDSGRRFGDDVVEMTVTGQAVRHGEVTVASREALTSVGVCSPGDVLALVEGDVVSIGGTLHAAAMEVVQRLLAPGGELVTLVIGQGADAGLAALVADSVGRHFRHVDVSVLQGDQPHYPLLIGVE